MSTAKTMVTDSSGIVERPTYGAPRARVFGRVMGTLAIDSRQQVRLLQRVLETGMRDFAGRHEETFLAQLYNDLAAMDRRAQAENWRGWNDNNNASRTIPA